MAFKGSTGTYWERLFAQNGAGNSLAGNSGAGTATLLSKQSSTYPLPVLDAGYFAPHYGVNKTVRVTARGVISFASAATPQTFSGFGVFFSGSDSTTIGTAICQTGTVTPLASQAVTNAIWELECDITANSVGTSGAMAAFGLLTIAQPTTTLAATSGAGTQQGQVGLGGTATVSVNTENAQYIQIGFTWTNANTSASNTVTCYQVLVDATN